MEYRFTGLSAQEVERSRREHGSNAITPQEVESFWDKLLDNFKDPMIIILVVALGIVTVLALAGFAEWYEGVGIAAAVALATFVSTTAEYKNEQAFQKLQEEASRIEVNVFRDGRINTIKIDDVVVGDFILLQPGDKIPADGRVAQGEMKVNQALLTGEPEAVTKKVGDVKPTPEDLTDLLNRHLLFRGTTVEDGEAVMEVLVVGDQSLFGKLAQELKPQEREGPLRVKLSKLADDIAKFGYIGASFIALSFMFKVIFMDNNFDKTLIFEYISHWQRLLYDVTTAAILAVIIIVVAVPEGLPMMVAIVLAQNMRKLLSANVLVRQLMGIETSGSLNMLFSDKTGTITHGKLEAVKFIPGFDPMYADYADIPEKLRSLLSLALRENTSCVITPGASGNPETAITGGNTTERAALKYVRAGIEPPPYERDGLMASRVVLFNSLRKFSATQVEGPINLTLVKGMPEIILDNATEYYDEEGVKQPFPEDQRTKLIRELDEQSDSGLRLIGVATSESPLTDDQLPTPLTLIGFVGIRDELRPESVNAIGQVQQAGIQVVMITGDKKGTAAAIAEEAGLYRPDTEDLILVSSEMNELSDDELREKLPDIKVIARSLPTDKSRLVKVAQQAGLVVGMTGDGVNDAPALNKADIGFGMGSGSEVAKEAAKIVILDDNFKSIDQAVLFGRTIYLSIQKFITFQLTVNVAAILVAFLGPFLGFNLPLTMIQLLWINLIMDTLAALAFSGEPPLREYMAVPPKDRTEHIITRSMWSSILLNGCFMALASVYFLKADYIRHLFHSDEAFMTAFFGFFVFLNNFNKFNVRVDGHNLFAHIFENKGFLRVVGAIFIVQVIITYFGGAMFRTVPLEPIEWAYITLFAMLIIPIDMARKTVRDAMGLSRIE